MVSLEGFNARALSLSDTGNERADIVTCDVSFISQSLLYAPVCSVLRDNGIFIPLIKPQFEAGRGNIGSGGIVRDRHIHEEIITRLFDCAAREKLSPAFLIRSPIEGGDGNTEYLACFYKNGIARVGAREIHECVYSRSDNRSDGGLL